MEIASIHVLLISSCFFFPVYRCQSNIDFLTKYTTWLHTRARTYNLRACLYGVELSLVGELPSPPSYMYLLPSVYMRKLSLLTEPKLGPVGSKDWRELF